MADFRMARAGMAVLEEGTRPTRATTGTREFTREEFLLGTGEENVPWFDSLSAGFQTMGIATGLVQGLGQPAFEPDPAFRPGAWLDQTQPARDALAPALEADDPLSEGVLKRLQSARSAAEAQHVVDQYVDAQHKLTIARANTSANVLGSIGGIGVDVVLAALLGRPFAGVASAGRGVVAGSQGMARLMAGTRLAGLGGAEGFAERLAQGMTDPSITQEDILTSAGLGALAGSVLGAVAPRMLGHVSWQSDDAVVLMDDTVDATEFAARSAGAAATPDDMSTLIRPDASERPFLSRIPGMERLRQTGIAQTWQVNPKSAIRDLGAAASRLERKGYQGALKGYDALRRLARLGTASANEIAGEGRGVNAENLMNLFEAENVTHAIGTTNRYKAAWADMFGSGLEQSMRRTAADTAKFLRSTDGFSERQFEAWADRWSAAAATEGADPRAVAVPEDVLAKLTPEQQDKLLKHVAAQAKAGDDFYAPWLDRMVETGLLTKEEAIAGYRPQRWNRDGLISDSFGFEMWMAKVLHRAPNDEWIVKSGLAPEGSTWASISASNRELASEILDEWAVAQKAGLEKMKEGALNRASAVRKNILAQAGAKREEDLVERLAASQRHMVRLEQRLTKAQGDQSILNDIQRQQAKIAQTEASLARLRKASDDVDELDRLIRQTADAATRKAARKAATAEGQATEALRKVEEAPDLLEEIRSIRQKLIDGEDLYGLVGDIRQTTGRSQRRHIHLGRHRFDPEADRFLDTDPTSARAAYLRSAGSLVALKKTFGRDSTPEKVIADIRKAFDEDRSAASAAGDTKALADIQQQARVFDRMSTHLFGRFTGTDLTNTARIFPGLGTFAAVAGRTNAAQMLHSAVLSQIGDIVVREIAGGRLGVAIRNMATAPRYLKFIKEVAGDNELLEAILRGHQVISMSRIRSYADLSEDDILRLRSKGMDHFLRGADKVANLSGWTNFMHGWSRIMRGQFGAGLMIEMSRDFAKIAAGKELPEKLVRFYARQGLGKSEMTRLAKFMADNPKKVNGVTVPDFAKMDPLLLEKFQTAFISAGDEAVAVPGFADMPFMTTHRVGGLILQFTSFMFTIADTAIAKANQELLLGNAAPYAVLAGGGMLSGIMTDALKAHARGEGEAWRESWDSPEGMRDRLYAGFLRSPIAFSYLGPGLEVMTNTLGGPLNRAVGTNVLPTAPTRFREQFGLSALAGPTVSNIDQSVRLGQRVIEGGDDMGERAYRKIPIINALPFQLLGRIWQEE